MGTMAIKHMGKVVVSASSLRVSAWEYGWSCTGRAVAWLRAVQQVKHGLEVPASISPSP